MMCHLSRAVFPTMCKSQVVPLVSVPLAAGFIALPLDESCLGPSCLHSPVPGRRLLEEDRLRELNFQADHALARGTTTLPLHSSTKVHTPALRSCSRSNYPLSLLLGLGAISEKMCELL